MESIVYGDLAAEGLEVVRREDRYFVRYDAGSHQFVWREDELSEEEFQQLRRGKNWEHSVLALQHRLRTAGEDPYMQNWSPPVP